MEMKLLAKALRAGADEVLAPFRYLMPPPNHTGTWASPSYNADTSTAWKIAESLSCCLKAIAEEIENERH
jgi:hypothetical protein